MNTSHLNYIQIITCIGIVFGIIIWSLLISAYLTGVLGGNFRYFSEMSSLPARTSWIGSFLCGIILIIIQRRKCIGWYLVASSIGALLVSYIFP